MRYELLDPQGRPREAGEGTLAVDGETLALTPRSGTPLVVKLGDIDAFEAADYRLRVALYTGDVLRCERLGATYEQTVATLSANRDAVLRRDLLLEREPPVDVFPASVHVSGWGDAPPRPARVLVYRDQAAVVGDAFEPVLIPFSGLDAIRVDAAAYAVELADEDGTRVAIRKLGIRFEEFAACVQDAVNELDRRAWAILDALVGGLDPMAARRLVRLCRDGRALKETEAEAVKPGLWASLAAAAIPDETLRASYETLRALGTPGQAWIGIREILPSAAGEDGGGESVAEDGEEEAAGAPPPAAAKSAEPEAEPAEETGAEGEPEKEKPAFLCWYYVQAGGAVAHEVVSEGNHATYLYRAGADADRGVRALNRALRLLSFRREPVYAPAEEIESGRLARYRLALRKLAPLRHARENFLGRALHTSPEAWRKGVQSAMKRA